MAGSFRDLSVYKKVFAKTKEVGRMLNHIIETPERYGPKR
jgi:hypothetical protein